MLQSFISYYHQHLFEKLKKSVGEVKIMNPDRINVHIKFTLNVLQV